MYANGAFYGEVDICHFRTPMMKKKIKDLHKIVWVTLFTLCFI